MTTRLPRTPPTDAVLIAEGVTTGHSDADLIKTAKKRFKKCADRDSVWRGRFVEDLKFSNADSRNMYQWPQVLRDARGYGTSDERPCLTINKTHQHNLQIINDARQNKTAIVVRPAGNGATYEAAQVIEGIVRHIEYISNAQAVYTKAFSFQVQAGIGYCRVVTDYADNETFDQEIYIREVQDPLGVYMDPDTQEVDGSDAKFGFIFADVDREEFEAQYPKIRLGATTSVLGNDEDAWIGKDKVRIAEYYYRNEVADELIIFKDPLSDGEKAFKRSDLQGMSGELREAFRKALADPMTKRRKIKGHEVKWVKIAGDEIVERSDWAGSTVPIVWAVGEKTMIDGELDIKGHTRCLIDPQNTYNYYASAGVEFTALQGKTPWLAAMESVGDLDAYWGRQNLDNLAWLPFNAFDDKGQPLPVPQRIAPPNGAGAYQQGMQAAAQDMMMVSGQYQPMMGEPSNERSGKAIQARQRQGENATYHFIDNQAIMIRRLGKIIIDLIPKIYDTPRMIKILGEDGQDSDVWLDPDAKKAFEKRKSGDTEAAERVVMNPNVGRYDVVSDPGPDYATRRQEAYNALSQIAQQNPELMSIIGDLVMLAADFPLADEAAERLKRMVPAQALGDGPNPQVVELQKQLQASQALMATMSAKLQELQSKTTNSGVQKDIDLYKAITSRLDVIMKHSQIPARELLAFQHDLAMQEHAANITAAHKTLDAELAAVAPEPDGVSA